MLNRFLVLVAIFGFQATSAAATPSFEGIGIGLIQGSPGTGSYVNGISADGSTVVGGTEAGSFRRRPAFWTEAGGLQVLDYVGGSTYPSVGAHDASADGSVIAGMFWNSAFRWTAADGFERVEDGRGGPGGALAISDDGLVLAGWNELGSRQSVWYSQDGVLINPPAPFNVQGTFEDLTPSGEFATGWLNHFSSEINPPPGRTEAVRWSVSGGIDFIPLPPGFVQGSGEGTAISNNGQIVVGTMGSFSGRSQPFLWDASTDESILLGEINELGLTSGRGGARALSGDGTVVVGRTIDGAFIWDEVNGMRLLADVLADVVGLDLGGWALVEATAISSNGLVIAGNGINADGLREGWVAVIPEPSTSILLGLGLFGFASSRRRHDHELVTSVVGFKPNPRAPDQTASLGERRGSCLTFQQSFVSLRVGKRGLVLPTSMLKRIGLVIVSFFSLSLSISSAAASPSFTGVGTDAHPAFPPREWEEPESRLTGISADGRYAVGDANDQIFRWSEAAGAEFLSGSGQRFTATAVSGDGSVVVGRHISNATPIAWTEATGVVRPSGALGAILAVSDDGERVGGFTDLGTRSSPWVSSYPGDGFQYIQVPGSTFISAGNINGFASGADYAVGWFGSRSSGAEPPEIQATYGSGTAIRWSQAAGIEILPLETIGASFTEANASSADGTIIVGVAHLPRLPGVRRLDTNAVIWDVAAGTNITLEDFDASDGIMSRALDVSADGKTVVGSSGEGAFIWDAVNGMRLVQTVLNEIAGLDLTGWTLDEAVGISADGLTIVGNGTNALGQQEGWIAVIPEPSTALLIGAGLLGLTFRRNLLTREEAF